MGAACSCVVGKDVNHLPVVAAKPVDADYQEPAPGPMANRSSKQYTASGTTKPLTASGGHRSGVIQTAAEPQPGEPGYDEWQKGQLLARTADEFGINLDPAANVAVEGETSDELSAVEEDVGGVCIAPSAKPMRFGYKIHHHCIKRHGSALIAAHEVKGHYTDTGIYLAYDVLQKILEERQGSDKPVS